MQPFLPFLTSPASAPTSAMTARRRRSVSSILRKWHPPGIVPSAVQDADWRRVAGKGYYGIPAQTGTDPFAVGVDIGFEVGHDVKVY